LHAFRWIRIPRVGEEGPLRLGEAALVVAGLQLVEEVWQICKGACGCGREVGTRILATSVLEGNLGNLRAS